MKNQMINMTERELLSTSMSVIVDCEKSEDMYVAVGIRDIIITNSSSQHDKITNEEEKECQGWYPYVVEVGSYFDFHWRFCKSDEAKYYGVSEFFRKDSNYVEYCLRNLPIKLIDKHHVEVWHLIYDDLSYKTYHSKEIALVNMGDECRDLVFGAKKDVKRMGYSLKKERK